ncbi:MAG: class I SAM-dependent methyltransferase [Bacteroidota bacterium]
MHLLNKLKEFNRKQQFEPGLFSLLTNANHFIKSGVYKGVKANASFCKGKLLDVGCGNKPYRHHFHVEEYIGIDIHNEAHDHSGEPIDLIYDGKTIPFGDKHFDSVFSSEVFEHVFHLEELIGEINRVMVKDGILLVTLPFVWIEHEKPNDFARYSSFGIRSLLERNGFEIVSLKKTSTYIEATTQLRAAYVYNTLLPDFRPFKVLGSLFFVSLINITGKLLSALLPDNPDLYLNNVVVARKNQDAVSGSGC